MAPVASERLRELQAQAARDSALLNREIDSGPTTATSRVSSFRVASDSAEDLERRPFLNRFSGIKLREVSGNTWRIWIAIAAAAVCSILLLWVLFGADETEMYAATKELAGKPLTASELKLRHPEDPCPSPFWFPEECRTDARTKSTVVHQRCQLKFDELGYSTALLIECEIIVP